MLLELFLTFAKVGAFTFGGGYAMISIIEDECVEKRKWITAEQLSTVTAIAESTPGPIAINCATYTGYVQAGVPGAFFATLGMVLPSFLIIYLISLFFDNFLEITVIANAFRGIRVAVGVLIARAAFMLWKKKKQKDAQTYIFAVAALVVMLAAAVMSIKISTIVLILAAGIISVIVYKVKQLSNKGGMAS